MNEARVIERLALTDAHAKHLPLPEESWTKEVAFSEIERRIGMQPQEPTEQTMVTTGGSEVDAAPVPDPLVKAPREGRVRPRSLVIATAFAMVLVVGVALWAVAASGGDTDATSGGGIDAAAGDPTITFDSSSLTCSYSGPTEFSAGVDATFTVVGDSDLPFTAGIVGLREGLGLSDIDIDAIHNPAYLVIGTDRGVELPENAADPTFTRLSLGVIEGTVPDTPRTWLVYCGSLPFTEPEFDHAAATFEVVAPS